MFVHVLKVGAGGQGDRRLRLNPAAVAYYYDTEHGSTVILGSGEAFEVRHTPEALDEAWDGRHVAEIHVETVRAPVEPAARAAAKRGRRK